MSSEDLEKSLRDSIDGYIDSRLGALQEEVTRLQSQINEAFTRISERLTSATQTDASVAVTISEHLHAAHRQGIEDAHAESSRTKVSSEVALLKAAVDDIDQQRTQIDILNALVNRTASFAPRVLFFVIKNERAMGWRARGLEGTIGDDAVREISMPLTADTLLSSAATSRATWSGAPGTYADDNLLFDKLGDERPQRAVAVPLVARNRAVAVLYADSAMLDSEAINLEALEALVRVAGMAVELLATARPAPPETKIPAPPPHRADAPKMATAAAAAAPSRESVEMPSAASSIGTSSTTQGLVPGDAPSFPDTPPSNAPSSEEMPRDGGMPNQATPPFATEPSFPISDTPLPSALEFASDANASSQPSESDQAAQLGAPTAAAGPLGAARRYGAASDLPVEVSDDQKRFHNDARRFARLLVSEIKLYNEQKVAEGREASDIYNRLRDEIDRSRQMYDKRVAPPVAASYDYFHHEIVNTLAEGDPAKMGTTYPGELK